MIESFADTDAAALALFDDIIDVRSPAEFAEDRAPGALNLPVLSNEERARIGTIYAQDSRFRARREGAALIARNVARHLETALTDKGPRWRPLLYCWRGGMRSRAMATILSEIGWRVGVLDGGYRTWRRAVVAGLAADEALDLILIDGRTGTAKSELIGRLGTLGIQTIDLERLAAHRGSVFGALPGGQPSQKLFESRLFDALRRQDIARPIVVEAESARIGRITLPARLWKAMKEAPRITVLADRGARADYTLRNYADFIASNAVGAAIERLKPFHSKERVAEWGTLAAAGDWRGLAEALMAEHYDPLYDRSARQRDRKLLGEIRIDALDAAGIDRAAEALAGAVRRAGRNDARPRPVSD